MEAFRKSLLLLLALTVFGCTAPINPHRPHRPDAPDVQPDKPDHNEPLDRAAMLACLADQIDAKNIVTTDDLVRVILILADQGDWTDADNRAVDELLPDLTEAKRALTADDAAKLREAK